MSKNPPNQKFSEWQQKARTSKSNMTVKAPTEDRLQLHCMVCEKSIEGFYSRHGEEGSCSKSCMQVQGLKPLYPGHSHEEFCQRFNI